jgi:zinc transport system substrate-binding protein
MRYIITLAFASTPAFAEVPKVVTDIPPVHALVAEVMGDLGQPVLLLDKGADEHDFQLRPSQAGAVAGADLVVWIGPELTPWLDSALKNRPADAAALGLLDAEGTALRGYGEVDDHDDHDHAADGHDDHVPTDAAQHDHGHEAETHAETAAHDDHGHDDHGHDDHGLDDHAHDGADPHAWLDPGNGKHWLGLIAAELSGLDPENSATYAANAAAAADRIDALDRDIAALLAPVKDRPIVTFHDAYGYFGAHYGLNFAGSIALGDAASPGAARLKELRTKLEAGEVLCIFPETQHDPALVTQMAEGTGARIGAALDPVGSSLEAGPGAYAALLQGMATTIADCVKG